MYYLYVKTHNRTGLKYLGKTTRDPFKYKGSGVRWTNHINEHGYDVCTEILLETSSREELKEKGKYYSKLWNVVNDYSWANLKAEEGDGGDNSSFIKYENTNQSFRKNLNYKEKVSKSCKGAWEDKFSDPKFDEKEFRKMCADRSRKMWASRGISDEDRKKRSVTQKKYLESNPQATLEMSIKAKEIWEKKSIWYEVTYPNGNKILTKCFRRWCEENNLHYQKLYYCIRHNKPNSEGWMVKKK